MAESAVTETTGRSRPALAAPWLALAAVAAVTAWRIVFLFLADYDLFFDEAQYWYWSTDLEGGYFSKPPAIAAVIAAATAVCGDGEACIRLGAPILYALAGLVGGLLARRMAGPFAGTVAAILFVTIPGVTFGARLISTDAPLLVAWAAALLFYHRYLETRSWSDALLLGLFVGLGFLAKYAMVYFGFCLAIHALVERRVIARLTDIRLWAALGVALLVLSPNIWWNLRHGAVTLAHTADNASWSGNFFHLDNLADFVFAQIGIIGPVLAALLAYGLWRHRRALGADERFLLAFSAPITLTMCLQALISRANANWAALSFVGFVVLAALFIGRWNGRRWLAAALATHLVALVGLSVIDTNARAWSLQFERTPFKRVLGWSDVSGMIAAVAEEQGARTIVSNSRSVIAQLTYYLRDVPYPVEAWLYADSPRNHYEQVAPATRATPGPILVVTRCPLDFADVFEAVTASGSVAADITRARERRLYWAVIGAMPENPPLLADCRG